MNKHKVSTVNSRRPLLVMTWMTILAVSAISATGTIYASDLDDSSVLKSGESFRRQLEAQTGIERSAQPIRAGIMGLAEVHKVACLLDRRVDPDQEVAIKIRDASLDEVFRHIAFTLDLGVSYTNSVVYIGPKSTAEYLATVAALRRGEVNQLKTAQQRLWRRPVAWGWKELARPRELIEELANEVGFRVVNLQQIPHDLWAKNQLPAMEMADRLTLILAGFDLTFRLEATNNTIELVPIPPRPVIQRTYPQTALINLETWERVAPNAKIDRRGNQISVSGTWEDHEAIARQQRGENSSRPAKRSVAETRYTLKVKNQPLGAVIQSLAMKVMLEVVIDDAAQPKMSQLVTFEVQNAKLADLLRAALTQAGLSFVLDKQKLNITFKEE